MWRTDFANITKMPMFGQVKLDHRLNSVLATKSQPDRAVAVRRTGGPRSGSTSSLHGMIVEVRNAVPGYKKHSPFEQDI